MIKVIVEILSTATIIIIFITQLIRC